MFSAIRQTLRSLGRSPGLTIAAAATIALGAALTTAMFAVVDGVLLRPLPFAQPERVVALRDVNATSSTRDAVSASNTEDLIRASKTIDRVALWIVESVAITAGDLPERVRGIRVSPSIFSTLGVTPTIGRPFHVEQTLLSADRHPRLPAPPPHTHPSQARVPALHAGCSRRNPTPS
jgi:putative ABC transport system permease protein